MIEQSVIEAVKQVDIASYLLSQGYYPAQQLTNSGKNAWLYNSPITNERTPSFWVSKENTFNCYSSGQKGDIIRLVRILEKLDFIGAVKRLQAFNNTAADIAVLHGQKPAYVPKSTAFVETVKPLQHWRLIQYVERRKIPFPVAFKYLKEVHYRNEPDGRIYFGVGWQTAKESWAVRSEQVKKWIGPASITAYPGSNPAAINLFEGYFDFLSALVYFRVSQLRNTTIILNSNSNLSQCLDRLKESDVVYTFLDTDGNGTNGGQQTMKRLHGEGINVVDRSKVYSPAKDFNEFLCTR